MEGEYGSFFLLFRLIKKKINMEKVIDSYDWYVNYSSKVEDVDRTGGEFSIQISNEAYNLSLNFWDTLLKFLGHPV